MAKRRGNNEGSIYQRTNGSWRAQITISGRRLSYTGRTRKECQKWSKEKLALAERGISYQADKTSIAKFLSGWLVSAGPSLSSNTRKLYRHIVKNYLVSHLGRTKLGDLRPDNIQAMYDQMVENGVGIPTVRLTHAVLHRSLNHAFRLGLLVNNPDSLTSPPRLKKKEMTMLNESQLQRLFVTANETRDINLPLYHLAVSTGMRQGELLGLQWKDIKWSRKILRVQRQLQWENRKDFRFKPPKTTSGIRTIALGSRGIKILREHRERQFREMKNMGDLWFDNDLVFPLENGKPMSQWKALYEFHKVCQRAGIPKFRFHDLRHTAASVMLNNNIPVLVVSQRLGHSQPSMTLNVYGHLIQSHQEAAADLMDELLDPAEYIIAPQLHQASEISK